MVDQVVVSWTVVPIIFDSEKIVAFSLEKWMDERARDKDDDDVFVDVT